MATTPNPASQASARGFINATLASFGLGSLSPLVWQKYLNGEDLNQIMLEIRSTPQYQARFPAMADLQKQGRAISEADYISYERTAAGLMRAYGLPVGFYDQPKDIAKFITNNVSVSELEERLKLASQAQYQAPPEVRNELRTLYGIDAGHLTAFWLDPQKAFPLLQQQFAAAQMGGAANISGYGQLTRQQAEALAGRGYTADQAYKAFGDLANAQQLFQALPGEAGYKGLTKDEQLGGAFGYNPAAGLKLQTEAAKRKAEFQGGGQYVSSQQGIEGLGAPGTQ